MWTWLCRVQYAQHSLQIWKTQCLKHGAHFFIMNALWPTLQLQRFWGLWFFIMCHKLCTHILMPFHYPLKGELMNLFIKQHQKTAIHFWAFMHGTIQRKTSWTLTPWRFVRWQVIVYLDISPSTLMMEAVFIQNTQANLQTYAVSKPKRIYSETKCWYNNELITHSSWTVYKLQVLLITISKVHERVLIQPQNCIQHFSFSVIYTILQCNLLRALKEFM